MEAVDSNVPEPERSLETPFFLPVEATYSITGRYDVLFYITYFWKKQDFERSVSSVCMSFAKFRGLSLKARSRENKTEQAVQSYAAGNEVLNY